jgi:MFS family permease
MFFRSLRSRNYRLFFAGQSISLIGTWMEKTAMAWLVYRMAHSVFLLGLVAFANQIPSFFVAPLAGVLIDRWNRHRVVLTTQILAFTQASIVSALVLTGKVQIWEIVLLSFFLGLVNSFDMPARQAFLIEMIEDGKDLGNAIALNSSMVHVARMTGPSLAGLLIAAAGEGVCFLLNAVSFLTVIAALLFMRIKPRSRPAKKRVLHGLREGISYAFRSLPIRSIILLLAMTSLAGAPYVMLMPVFARDILHGGPNTLGFLMGASGVGALAGAILLASRKSVLGLGKMIASAPAIFGLALIAFSHSRIFWLSFALLIFAGFGLIVQIASSNTILQTIVDDDKRGRVMSLYIMAFMGMAPFGSLLLGSLSKWIGAPNALMAGGICCILGSFVFARQLPYLREIVRPIYVKMGIIPHA